MTVVTDLVESAELVVTMTWDTWWALVLGFALSGAVEAFVGEATMRDLLGDDDWRAVGRGALLGAASSSCSYSAVGTTKTVFKKGASGAASLGAFMFASTDLVVELGLVLWVLLGWQFVVGEYLGGVVAVLVLGAVFRYVVPPDWVDAARAHLRATDETACGTCDVTLDPEDPETVSDEYGGVTVYFCCGGCRRVYAAREGDDSRDGGSSANSDGAGLATRLLSADGWRSASRAAMKDWEMLWTDVALGFLLAGLVAGFVPAGWWAALFPAEGSFGGVVAATAVAIAVGALTFMCSVGNVPFALVLWRNGLPFGAVLSFVYADLLIPPLVNVYRKYYGARMAATLVLALTLAAAVAGVTVHYVAGVLGIVPPAGTVGGTVPDGYTTVLNLVFTPVFCLQVVATYGLDTVRDRAVATLRRLAGGLRSTVRAAGRAVELTTGATAAALADPAALGDAFEGATADDSVAPLATARRAGRQFRATLSAAVTDLATTSYRFITALADRSRSADGTVDPDDGDGATDDPD